MLWNFILIAWRNLIRRKFFSAINIFGLAVAMAFSILIFLWIEDELKYDQFHAHGDKLYRVLQTQFYENGKISSSDRTAGQLAAALKSEMPEVEKAAMMSQLDFFTFKVDDKVERESGGYASEDLFLMFSFPFVKGDIKNCLSSADQIVISQKLASKYFGTDNPLGKAIHIDNRKDFFVSGVFADVPKNSSLQFDFVLPYKEYENAPWAKDWGALGDKTFLLLRENASPASLNDKIKNFLKSKIPGTTDQLTLQPYSEMYLYSNIQEGIQDGGRIDYVRVFSIVAILILAVACINYMNLATAQSLKRAKEVGIRKVVGAGKSILVKQFMGEAILTSVFALIVALFLVELLLPSFSILTEKVLSLRYMDAGFILVLVGLTITTGIVSGSYPALFLSSLQPVKILTGKLRLKSSGFDLRKALVVFQFGLSITFILASIVVYQQLQFIQGKNLGLDRENIIYQTFEGELPRNLQSFKTELSHSPGIQSVTYSNQPMLRIQNSSTWIDWPGKTSEVVFSSAGVSYDYCKTMKIQLSSGRDFSPEFASDSLNVLINEEAARQMGLTDPIGHEITTQREILRKGKIIGVMKDFHLQSLHTPIEPLCIFLDTYPGFGYITVRTEAGKTKDALASMEKVNKKYNPNFPFNFSFATEDFKREYVAETLLGELSKAFSFLTICISCLGLFALATFSVEQRAKEIGIRKVLGATVANVIQLLSKDFIKLILIAFLIAAPTAWHLMHQWLQEYAYRIEMRWWMVGMAGGGAVLIAVITVSAQAVKVAVRNPVDSLRAE